MKEIFHSLLLAFAVPASGVGRRGRGEGSGNGPKAVAEYRDPTCPLGTRFLVPDLSSRTQMDLDSIETTLIF